MIGLGFDKNEAIANFVAQQQNLTLKTNMAKSCAFSSSCLSHAHIPANFGNSASGEEKSKKSNVLLLTNL